MRKNKILIIITSLITSACNLSTVHKPISHPSTASIDTHVEVTTHQEQTKDGSSLEEKHIVAVKDDTSQTHQTAADKQYTNVWHEIRDQLQLDRQISRQVVENKLTWFARNQAYLDRVADRATPYLYHIVQELKKRDMPLDIALLPIVESAYHPFAYSPSRASGIWQFIPGTGKRFGLKQNWWYDGRRDILAATDAALNYLEQLNQRFDGDWLLAMAAYNSGEYNVERAIKRNKKQGKSADFWSLRLPRETRNYVPSLLAISEIIANPEKYNINLKPVPNQPYFEKVPLDGQIDLAKAAELSGLSMDELYTLNPGFNRWATDPNGPHHLLIPVDKAESFQTKLASLPVDERIAWKQHKIEQGDTLGLIALRFNTSVAALKQTNRLKNNRIRAGRSLLIPVSQKPLKHYTLSQDSRRYQGLKRSGDGKKYTYTIKRGDTLWDISRHYGISVTQLCKWNGISRKSTLRLGQKLDIYVKDEETETGVVAVAAHSVTVDGKKLVRYEIQEGDSLWLISKKFGVSVTQLRDWNKIPKGRILQPGQNLDVYVEETATGV